MLAHALSFGKHAEIICYGFNEIKMLNKNRIGNSNVFPVYLYIQLDFLRLLISRCTVSLQSCDLPDKSLCLRMASLMRS